ncbi:hypothetical protein S83_059718, partial [Arachis hypogaea]
MLPSVNSSSLLLLIAVSITEPLFLPLTLVRNLGLLSPLLIWLIFFVSLFNLAYIDLVLLDLGIYSQELDSHFLSSSREHKRSRGAKHTSACESLPPFPSARQYQLLALPVAGNIMKEAGPVSMTFDIPIYHALRLQTYYFRKGILFRRSSRRGILLLIKIKDLSKN